MQTPIPADAADALTGVPLGHDDSIAAALSANPFHAQRYVRRVGEHIVNNDPVTGLGVPWGYVEGDDRDL